MLNFTLNPMVASGVSGNNSKASQFEILGSLSGAMNSWFYHEFVVYSMGSILANIMNYLGKFD